MAIEIREKFEIQAPIDAVWQFLTEPHRVVTCMPGAALDEVVDGQTFLGSVKVKVGAITTSYKGRVQFALADEQAHQMKLVAEGQETGGGTAKGTMKAELRSLSGGRTEVVAEASVDLTGRIIQVGRGMIQGVAHQIFLQFVARMRGALEAVCETAGAMPLVQKDEPLRIVPLMLRVLREAVVRFFRRLFRGG